MKQPYLNLDFEEIQKAYPNAVQEVVRWFCDRDDIIQGLVGMGGDKASKSEIQEAMKQVVPIIIQYDPRKLYDFFDDKHIIVSIAEHDGDMFAVYNNVTKHSVPAESRSEAERIGFTEAFAVLERHLSNPNQGEKTDEKAKGNKSDEGSK